VRYSVELAVNPTQDTFQGKMDIDLEVTEATSLLWLNATELKISSTQLSLGGAPVPTRVVPGDADFVGFAFERPVPVGPARLSISYEGAIDKERTRGLYREKDKETWYAYTVFEPVDARRVFPCFDEPGFKVPWRLSLRVRSGDVALANTAIESQGAPLADGTRVVTFAETKPLPSYLIAFVVGPFVDGTFSPRDGMGLLFVSLRGRTTRATAYAFVKENFDKLVSGLASMEGAGALFQMPAFFCDKASRQDAEAFFTPRASKVDGAPLSLRRSLERVDLCIAAQERNKADITAFLKRY
jgi:aminopeptidase N